MIVVAGIVVAAIACIGGLLLLMRSLESEGTARRDDGPSWERSLYP